METVSGGGSPWPAGVDFGGLPATDPGARRSLGSRLGRGMGLLVVAALAGGLTFALAQESGLAALTGRRAVASVSHCQGHRARTCDAVVIARDGTTLDWSARLASFTRVSSPSNVRVRYRDGKTALDSLPERTLQVAMLWFFGVGAVAALLGAVASLVGRNREVARKAAGAAAAGVPVVVISLVGAVVVGVPAVGSTPILDIYAKVAAEPGRALMAQGVHFDLVDNQPMARTGCAGAPGCVSGAAAHWKVTGTDLVATSYLLVFQHDDQAAAFGAVVTRDRAVPGVTPPPPGSVIFGHGTGRYGSAIWLSRTDGSDAAADPAAESALRGLSYFNLDQALAGKLRSR